jgi:hypothetical protein
MRKRLILLACMLLGSVQAGVCDEISRHDVQNLFNTSSGNASYSSRWQNYFLNKHVNWKGTIFTIQYQKDFNRTEVTMKILPGTMMYDTIIYVPGDITDQFEPKDEVSFSGSITRGIDMLGVKEVQVNVGRNMGDNFGNYIFTEQGMVNVNFLKPNNTPPSDN